MQLKVQSWRFILWRHSGISPLTVPMVRTVATSVLEEVLTSFLASFLCDRTHVLIEKINRQMF